jgi:serine/threonine-protein kinase RsbW
MTAERRSFPARTAALANVTGFIEAWGAGVGLPRQTILRMVLVIEELFINTVLHGYGGDSGEQVSVTLNDRGAEVELIVEDQGPVFDPFQALPTVTATASPFSRQVGGLGRLLVSTMCTNSEYERRGDTNVVTVSLVKNPK